MSSDQNPADADLGNCRENQSKEQPELWLALKGPDWLSKPEMWPASVQIGLSRETEAETKLVKEVISVAVETEDSFHQVQQKHGFWQTIRITS